MLKLYKSEPGVKVKNIINCPTTTDIQNYEKKALENLKGGSDLELFDIFVYLC